MRKIVLSIAAAGAALIAASPAAAQYYPQPQPYGYGGQTYGYGQQYGFGFQNNYRQVRALQARIDRIEWQINRLDRRDRIGDRSADRLRYEAERIEQRLRYSARGGLNPYEMRDIEVRIARLEQRVQYSLASGYGRYGYGYNGYGNGYIDRDGDGRDDNLEHQRWHQQHDGDRDDD
jgi:opacity protein-like surface antigen